METTIETVVPEHYNPNQLVTYKVLEDDGNSSFPTVKVTNIEWLLELSRGNEKVVENYNKFHRQLEGELQGWLENDTSAEDIVSEICQIFGFIPEKEIPFEATATITGTVRVPFDQLNDFDIEDVDLNAYVESSSHDVDTDIEIDNIYRV